MIIKASLLHDLKNKNQTQIHIKDKIPIHHSRSHQSITRDSTVTLQDVHRVDLQQDRTPILQIVFKHLTQPVNMLMVFFFNHDRNEWHILLLTYPFCPNKMDVFPG